MLAIHSNSRFSCCRLDTAQNRPRRRLKFDSSRVVGNSIEFLSNGAEAACPVYRKRSFPFHLCILKLFEHIFAYLGISLNIFRFFAREVRSLRDARSFAVASQPLSAENGTFYACLTWHRARLQMPDSWIA